MLAAIGLFCFALLVYAYYLQYGPDKQQPCPLCVLQRYVYFLLGMISLLASIVVKHSLPRPVLASTALLAALLASLGGAGLAMWQVLKGGSMTSCQTDPIGIFVNSLPFADWWPEYLFANGGCSDKYFAFGVPVPLLSLGCFVLIAILIISAMLRAYQQQTLRR